MIYPKSQKLDCFSLLPLCYLSLRVSPVVLCLLCDACGEGLGVLQLPGQMGQGLPALRPQSRAHCGDTHERAEGKRGGGLGTGGKGEEGLGREGG